MSAFVTSAAFAERGQMGELARCKVLVPVLVLGMGPDLEAQMVFCFQMVESVQKPLQGGHFGCLEPLPQLNLRVLDDAVLL